MRADVHRVLVQDMVALKWHRIERAIGPNLLYVAAECLELVRLVLSRSDDLLSVDEQFVGCGRNIAKVLGQ